MPTIEIYDETTYKGMQDFKRVVDQVSGQEISTQDYTNLVLRVGLRTMIREILQSVTQEEFPKEVLWELFRRDSELISSYIAQEIEAGVFDKEGLRDKLEKALKEYP